MPEKNRQKWGIALIVTVCVLVAGCLARSLAQRRSERFSFESGNGRQALLYQAPIQSPDGWLDVNAATMDELTELKGIGETLAANLIDEREHNGWFYYPEDLLCVKGIGPAKLGQIRDELCFSVPEAETNGE